MKEFQLLIDILLLDKHSIELSFSCYPIEVMDRLTEAAAKAIAYYTFPGKFYTKKNVVDFFF